MTLQQLLGFETLATVWTLMDLAVDLLYVLHKYKLMGSRVVTLLVITMVQLTITALSGMVRPIILRKISVTLQTKTSSV